MIWSGSILRIAATTRLIEGVDQFPTWVGRLIEQVIPGHPGVAFVMICDRLPEPDGSVLKMFVLPEKRLLGGVIRMPVLILVACSGMQVQDGVNFMVGAYLDHPVELLKAGFTHDCRIHIVFKMMVIERQTDQVHAQRADKGCILIRKEIFKIALE